MKWFIMRGNALTHHSDSISAQVRSPTAPPGITREMAVFQPRNAVFTLRVMRNVQVYLEGRGNETKCGAVLRR